MAEWRNRIVGEGEMAPIDLMEAANPDNPRLHPDRQEQALEDILDKVGFIDRVIVNKRTGKLIDGHLRVKMALAKGEARLPVEYVDLSPEEEKLVLSTFDPIAGLAEFDPEILKGLAESVRLDFDFDLSGVFGEDFWRTVNGDELVEDYKEFDEQLAELDDFSEILITIAVPRRHKERVIEWLSNGEAKTSPGMGKGVLRRCGLL